MQLHADYLMITSYLAAAACMLVLSIHDARGFVQVQADENAARCGRADIVIGYFFPVDCP